jgi:hypothetical protein
MRNQSAQTESMEQIFKAFVTRIELLTKEQGRFEMLYAQSQQQIKSVST